MGTHNSTMRTSGAEPRADVEIRVRTDVWELSFQTLGQVIETVLSL